MQYGELQNILSIRTQKKTKNNLQPVKILPFSSFLKFKKGILFLQKKFFFFISCLLQKIENVKVWNL